MFRGTGKSADFPVPYFHREGRDDKHDIIPQCRCFRRKQALEMLHSFTTPPVKRRLERSAERDKRKISNNDSAVYAQSATTTTAANGGNREELLGQRPARRACRPRHDADAGCRNPISGAHYKSSGSPGGPLHKVLCSGLFAPCGRPLYKKEANCVRNVKDKNL